MSDMHVINFCYQIPDNCYVTSVYNKDAIQQFTWLVADELVFDVASYIMTCTSNIFGEHISWLY